jgi:uncharacterized protein (DUF4415 family)
MKSASHSSTRSVLKQSASSRHEKPTQKKNERIISYTLDELLERPFKSDIARLKATTDEDIARQIAEDPDLQEAENRTWSEPVFVRPVAKQAISIRVDNDILAFFKAQGAGYQGRMNAVLRQFMESTRKAG